MIYMYHIGRNKDQETWHFEILKFTELSLVYLKLYGILATPIKQLANQKTQRQTVA